MCFRYKFFFGSGLGATFMNIGDGDGMGEDHCELVGGSENNAVPAEYKILLRVYGKYTRAGQKLLRYSYSYSLGKKINP